MTLTIDSTGVERVRPVGREERLGLVEALRAFAAVSIVVFHAAGVVRAQFPGADVPMIGLIGDRGVDIFFVLTGFVTVLGGWQPWARWLARRLVRIVPLLWIVVLGFFAVKIAVLGQGMGWDRLAISLVPIPVALEPAPIIVWTLRHVFLFYAMVALVLAAPRWGGWAMGLWLAGAVVQTGLGMAGTPMTGLAAFVFSSFHLQFALGGLAAWVWTRGQVTSLVPALAGIGAGVAFLVAQGLWPVYRTGTFDYVSPQATGWMLVSGLAIAAMVYGLARAEGMVRIPGLVRHLGAASFAIYLVHGPLMGMLAKIWVAAGLPPTDWIGAALVLAALGGGMVLHHAVERPMTAWAMRRLARG